MKLHEYLDQKKSDAYNEGWNCAILTYPSEGKVAKCPETHHKGSLLDAFRDGFREGIDHMIIEGLFDD